MIFESLVGYRGCVDRESGIEGVTHSRERTTEPSGIRADVPNEKEKEPTGFLGRRIRRETTGNHAGASRKTISSLGD